MIDTYINEWQRSGHIWARECQGTAAECQQADALFPAVVQRLEVQGQLVAESNPRRIWDYCVGNITVDDVIDEL